MKRLYTVTGFLFISLLLVGITAATAADNCLTCHEMLGDKASQLFQHDVHKAKGISCAGCHGGNARSEEMETAMAKQAGFVGVPKGDAISERCATCHSNPEQMKHYGSKLPTGQFEQLIASVHGKLTIKGSEHIAQCTTCHGAHGIAPVTSPRSPVSPLNIVNTCASCHANAGYMQTYNPALPVDQLQKYRTSVHGMRNAKGDTNVAECASCHGSHNILRHTDAKSRVYPLNLPKTCAGCHSNEKRMKPYGIPTDQYEKFAGSVHGNALFKKQDLSAPACNDCHGNHGATPPGVESVSKVCGTCHALNADLFASSPHKKAFDARHLPECATCHNNHDIAPPTNMMVGTNPEATCVKCHSSTDNPKGFATAGAMRTLIDSLEAREAYVGALVNEAEQKGMAIGEAKFTLRNVRQARLETRTIVHAFNMSKFTEVVNKGFTAAAQVQQEAQGAIDEYYFRRIGLGISTLIITLLAVTLFLYIRRIEREKPIAAGSPKEADIH